MERDETTTETFKPSGGFYPSCTRVCLFPDMGGEGAVGSDAGGGAGAAVADAGNGGGGDAGGVQQTAGGASIVNEGGAAGGGAENWAERALPADHWAVAKGLKTWGDFDRLYRESSNEARHWRSQAESSVSQIAEALLSNRQQGQQQPAQAQVPQASAQNNWFGYGTQEAYAAAFRADPQGAMQRVVLSALQGGNQELSMAIRKLVAPELEPMQQDLQHARAAAFSQQVQSAWNAFEAAHPEFKQGTPLFNAMDAEIRGNQALQQLARTDPNTAWELVAGRIQGRIQTQQLTAAKQKLTETRNTAGTARTGAGGSSNPRTATIEQALRQKAEESAKAGQPVPPEEIEAAIQRAVRIYGKKAVFGNEK